MRHNAGEGLAKGDHFRHDRRFGHPGIGHLALEDVDPGTHLVGEESSEELQNDSGGARVLCAIF